MTNPSPVDFSFGANVTCNKKQPDKMKATALILILNFAAFGFTNAHSQTAGDQEFEKLRAENDSLRSKLNENGTDMEQQITTFLTFQENNAEEAMNFYVALFDNSEIIDIQRYGKDGLAKEDTIMKATFKLNGKEFICSDSYIRHDWTFTPAVSMFVACRREDEIDNLFAKLSDGGEVAMPLDNYGFSQKFGWVVDKFGVSWQLNFQ